MIMPRRKAKAKNSGVRPFPLKADRRNYEKFGKGIEQSAGFPRKGA